MKENWIGSTAAVVARGFMGILWMSSIGCGHELAGEYKANHRLLKSPSVGEYRALVVLMRFQDHADRTLPEPSYFQSLCDGSDTVSAAGFFRAQSGNQYQVDCEVVPQWIDTDNTEAFYSYGTSGLVQGSQAHDM